MSDAKKRNWFVRLLRAAVVLCLLGVGLFWGAKMWVLPHYVRNAASSYLDEVWYGTIEIGDVDANLFSPSYVRGVKLRDELGRTWVSVPEVRVDIAWDGMTPRLEGIGVLLAEVSPQFAGGKCVVPLKPLPPSDEPTDLATIIEDIKDIELTVGVVRLHAVNAPEPPSRELKGVVLPRVLNRTISRANVTFPKIEWRRGELSVAKALGEIGDDQVTVYLGGGLQPDRSVAFRGRGTLLADEEVIKGSFDISYRPGGAVAFDVNFDGQAKLDLHGDIQADRTTKTTLDVRIPSVQPDEIEWLIGSNEIAWLALESADVKVHFDTMIRPDMSADVTGEIDLSGPIGNAKAVVTGKYASDGAAEVVAKIKGSLCGGILKAEVKAVHRPKVPLKLAIDGAASNVSMPGLTRVLFPDRIMEKGTGAGELRMTIDGANMASLKGRGAFFLDDAHLWKTPILAALFKHMKLKFDKSDLQARFTLAGTTAAIQTGQLATTVWAADFEPGGTVDLNGGKVDMYVLFLPIKQAGAILKLLDPLKLLTKQVLRLHVSGNRDDAKVTPVPFSDVAKIPSSALDLLKGVTKTGGQLGGDVFKAILNGID